MKKERIDILLVEQGFFDSREQAKRSIMAGIVLADNERVDKPGTKIERSASLRIKGETLPYVSRGGLKLEKALKIFPLDVEDKVVIDIGASTGGFTDCALQNGAKYVYSVDVGNNQLAWKLRNHDKVEVMERFNFRYAAPHDFEKGQPQAAVADVSFISLKLLLEPLSRLLPKNGEACLLVKPQFEAGREKVGKKGIVRDHTVHAEVLEDIITFSKELGFCPNQLAPSPITGGDGNIEFLLYLIWDPDQQISCLSDSDINNTVHLAHTHF
ncbi:TlyA family RNA methyltransferase [Salibacterium salarium]|uniref:TlyA family RNA methyltransferase n=1 Tax=Salibacterium salarium TaxID=284579 RepID=A0A3R9QRS3_9BACI|nr:TlyA family RNA methyltransferase [Salibacterium salarium]RSL31991.1 TlyA family RNA methyltransferase [Salibacterium salarium]